MTDIKLIELLETYPVILNKGNTPQLKLAKRQAWNLILNNFTENKVATTTEKQLYKKWTNIRSRTMEKLRKRSATGGGSEIKLNDIDERVINLIGERNPNINRVPGACSSSALTTMNNATFDCDNDSEDNQSDVENTPLKKKPCVSSNSKSPIDIMLETEQKRLYVEEQRLEIEKQRLVIEQQRLQSDQEIIHLLQDSVNQFQKSKSSQVAFCNM